VTVGAAAKDKLTDKNNAADPLQDPTKVRSEKADFGPLPLDWLEQTPASKCMCSYKVVTIKVAWWGLQTKAENWLIGTEEQIFLRFHKQLLCWMDEWFDLSLEDVLAKERAIYEEMNKNLAKEGVTGSGAADQAPSSSSAETSATTETDGDGEGEKKKKKKHRKHKGGRSGHHGGKKHRHHEDGDGEAPAEADGAADGEKKPKKDKKKKKDGAAAEEDTSASVSASVEHTEESGDNSGSESDDE
jgi:hypothetical protein